MPTPTFSSELAFEAALVGKLQQYGWSGGVLRHATEHDLRRNWADIIFQNNRGKDRLNNFPLTDDEVEQLVERVENLRTPFRRNAFVCDGTTTLRRTNPDDVAHLGRDVTLKLFDRQEIQAGQSVYQIAEQPHFHTADPFYDRRGDLALLINGMPVVHIELKRSGVPLSQATCQIQKYAHEGVFSRGMFALVQLFVAMTPEDTVYFANPGAAENFRKEFFFHWADTNNEPLRSWDVVAPALLRIPRAHELVGRYTVADDKDQVLKVMRSYQYYAASAIADKVADRRTWDAERPQGGYVWHTTGSGKTMTSFKAAQVIVDMGTADKVVFLMDRIELGTQSLADYRGFAVGDEDVQDTTSTDDLLAKLRSTGREARLIVSSIQKMSLVYARGDCGTDGIVKTGGYAPQQLAAVRAKKLVFVIDECHRSTFSEMLATIRRTFPHALLFGFTGTPIVEENAVKGLTTHDLFGPCLHTYTVADGIRDGNVLGFDTCRVLTLDEQSTRQAVALDAARAATVDEALADKDKAEKFYEVRAWPMAGHWADDGTYVKGIEDCLPSAQYRTEEHRERVVADVVANFGMLSRKGKFHAMLATASIAEAIAYYRLLKLRAPQLKTTAIFDPNIDNNEGATMKVDGLVEILADYGKRYGGSYTLPTWPAFKKDVARRLAHKAPYDKVGSEGQLDMVIVVSQLLTGYDSKWVNTLYLDRTLDYADLIQAFSRTNRLFGHDKPHGIVRYYRRPFSMARDIEAAFRLYAGGKDAGVFVSKIGDNIRGMNASFERIGELFGGDFSVLPDDAAARGVFAKEWKTLNACLDAASLQGFAWTRQRYDYADADGRTRRVTVRITRVDYNALTQRYKELFAEAVRPDETGEAATYDIEPHLVATDAGLIDYAWINTRVERYARSLDCGVTQEERDKCLREVSQAFATLTIEQQTYANIFIHDVEHGAVTLAAEKPAMDYIAEYQRRGHDTQIHRFAQALGLDEDALRQLADSAPTEQDINRGGRLDRLVDTRDNARAAEYFAKKTGNDVPARLLRPMTHAAVKAFLLPATGG